MSKKKKIVIPVNNQPTYRKETHDEFIARKKAEIENGTARPRIVPNRKKEKLEKARNMDRD